MRFMVLVKADQNIEAGVPPSEQRLAAMMKHAEELAKAGVLRATERLHPSSKGARVTILGGQPVVTDGPFTEAKELIAGFALWEVVSKEEAIEWLKRAPFDGEFELRQVFEAEEVGPALTPELQELGKRISAQMARRQE